MKWMAIAGMLALIVCAVVVAGNSPTTAVPAASPVEKLVFKGSGFSIAPLDWPPVGDKEVPVLSMSRSATKTSVMVQVGRYSGTVADFARGSVDFAKGDAFMKTTVDEHGAIIECSAPVNGQKLHMYNRAVIANGILYYAGGGTTEDQWAKAAPGLKACVDSIEAIQPGQRTDKIAFRSLGFAIAPLKVPDEAGDLHSMMMAMLTTSGGVAGVNVSVVPFAGTAEEYAATYRKAFGGKKPKIISDKLEGAVLLLEYEADLGKTRERFYQRSVLSEGKVFFIQATAPVGEWDSLAAKLMACAGSFEILQAGKPGEPVAKSASSAEAAK